MLVPNMAVKNSDVYGDMCGGVHNRLVTVKGINGVLLVARMSGAMATNLFSVYDGRGTSGKSAKNYSDK